MAKTTAWRPRNPGPATVNCFKKLTNYFLLPVGQLRLGFHINGNIIVLQGRIFYSKTNQFSIKNIKK